MISTSEALDKIFGLVTPVGVECVGLRSAIGRVPAGKITALHNQPPFPSSAMDGYAIADREPRPGQRFNVMGESAAGHGFTGSISGDEAVRIFTGAPVPIGGQRVLIQEDVTREGSMITLDEDPDRQIHIRRAGLDFAAGDAFAPRRPLRPSDIALIAAMGHDRIPIHRRPEIAIIATGDELVMPGEIPAPDQIVASNHIGLAAMIEQAGGIARLLPIARDTRASLSAVFGQALGADMIVTIGGASVGDHDLVARHPSLTRSFYKVAMRPGKPLMAGRLAGTPLIGLPGNPVSALVCGMIFILPMVRILSGLPAAPAPRETRILAHPLDANGRREHYMRARMDGNHAHVFDSQDSSRLSILSQADLLVIRPPHDPAREAGEKIDCILLA